jgi:hypothetical protein
MVRFEFARPSANGLMAALRTSLAAPITALMLAMAGCGGGGDGSPGTAGSCGAGDCGSVYVGLTDADGDFPSYTVDVVSLTLTNANGAVVETLPVSTRVDFAQLVDFAEFVTAATVPSGAYVAGRIRLDYRSAEVSVEVAGEPRAATVVDANGQPLGTVDLDIRLDDRNHVIVSPGRPAFVQLDFDLSASHAVDVTTTPVTAVAEPLIVATVEPVDEKELRARGPLVSVDTANSSYAIEVRPFHHQSARLGDLTINTTAQTAFEIDGTAFTGAAGLEALAQQAAGTPTVAFGELALADREFTAKQVFAGTSVPGPLFDVLWGNVMARDGDTLTVRGATLIRRSGTFAYLRRDITLLVGPNTVVTRVGQRGTNLTEDAISVGQRIHAFGAVSEINDELVLDAQSGRVRLHLTRLSGTVVTANPGTLSIDLASIDGRRPAIFDFSGTGTAPATDADPGSYEIDTGVLDVSRLLSGSPTRVFGFVTPFGAAPPDFEGRTVVDFEEVRAVLGLGWGFDGTSAPFLSLNADGLVIDNANADIGLRHFIAIGPILIDITALPTPPTIAPADGAGLYAIGEPGRVEVFSDFAAFTARLSERLAGGSRAVALAAGGQFDAGSSTLTARQVNIGLTSSE